MYAQVFSLSLVIIFEITTSIVIMELCMKATLLVTYTIPPRLIFYNQ